jgi:SAM-dependent methyltransferase
MLDRVDFGKTADDYKQFRQGFPPRFFAALASRGIGKPGQRILDLGTGTGTVARGLALAGGQVTAIDPAGELLKQARVLDSTSGVNVDYHVANAEHLPFQDGCFDIVTAGQCWHWFDSLRVLAEVRRVLVSGGTLIIAHFDWLPLPESPVELTEKLILEHNPKWGMSGGNGFYPRWALDAHIAGATDIETQTFDLPVNYSHEAWRGRIRASAGVGAALSPSAVADFDRAHEVALKAHFPEDPLVIPHRVFILYAHLGSK